MVFFYTFLGQTLELCNELNVIQIFRATRSKIREEIEAGRPSGAALDNGSARWTVRFQEDFGWNRLIKWWCCAMLCHDLFGGILRFFLKYQWRWVLYSICWPFVEFWVFLDLAVTFDHLWSFEFIKQKRQSDSDLWSMDFWWFLSGLQQMEWQLSRFMAELEAKQANVESVILDLAKELVRTAQEAQHSVVGPRCSMVGWVGN